MEVACLSSSPQLLQALAFRRLSGRFSPVFDSVMRSNRQSLIDAVYMAGLGADLVLIDGTGGFLDGPNSDLELAQAIGSPIVIVANGFGFRETLGSIWSGIKNVSQLPSMPLIANHLRHSDLAAVTAGLGAEGILGVIEENKILAARLPHGVSTQEQSVLIERSYLVELAKLVREKVNVQALLELAASSEPRLVSEKVAAPPTRRVRIAVAEDACFGVCFQNNLTLLRQLGAEIVPFSPLLDPELPKDVGGVIISGGFLRHYAEDLNINRGIRQSIRQFAERGGVLLAEGAGAAYLCEQVKVDDQGTILTGVGLIRSTVRRRKPHPAICSAETNEESIFGPVGQKLEGVDSGDWEIEDTDRSVKLLKFLRDGKVAPMEGLSPYANALVSFAHFNLALNISAAENLLLAASV